MVLTCEKALGSLTKNRAAAVRFAKEKELCVCGGVRPVFNYNDTCDVCAARQQQQQWQSRADYKRRGVILQTNTQTVSEKFVHLHW